MNFTLNESILVIVSILVTSGCFNVALYFGYHRKLAYLFFAFYCFFHCFKIYLKTYQDNEILIPLFSLTAFELVYLSVLMGMISLSAFLALRFEQPHKSLLIPVYIMVSLCFFFFIEELHYIFFSLGIAMIQSIYALRANKNAMLILVGLVGFAICEGLALAGVLNWGYFVGVIFLILCMVLSSSIELAAQNKEYQNALLRSARLENQLLKTTIQPHFILNSLTSLQELIEHDPQKASNFVHDLSKEFELFAKISDRNLIPVMDEIALINSYIGIMSVRKSVRFELKTENLSDSDDIPPGVFLTLIENGISHGYENRTKGTFRISKFENGNSIVYRVSNDGDVSGEFNNSGIGLNYVLARLKESYGENFKFESSAVSFGWQSTINIWS